MSHINADVLFGWSLTLLLLEDLGVLYGNVTVADEPGFLRDDTADQGEQSGAGVHISHNHSCHSWHLRAMRCLAPSPVPCFSSPRGTSWPASRCIRWASSCGLICLCDLDIAIPFEVVITDHLHT